MRGCAARISPRCSPLRLSARPVGPLLCSANAPSRRFSTGSSDAPPPEPELVRPISPGYRLQRQSRSITVRTSRLGPGVNEIARARTQLREQEKKGVQVQYSDLAALLERASRANDFDTAKELLSDMAKRGMKHTSGRALRSLMQAYARCDNLPEVEWTAQQVIMSGHELDVWCFNAWISALVRRGKIREAEAKLANMKKQKLEPTVITYHALLSGYANEGDAEKALGIVSEMERLGLPWTEYTWTPLVHMYARRGEPDKVIALMEKLQGTGVQPTVRIYNSLLSALAKANQFDKMPRVLKEMVANRVPPATETYNTLIAAHARLGDFAAAQERVNEMRSQKLSVDLLTFAPLVAARCKRGELEEAEAVLKEMKANKVVPTPSEGMLVLNGWISQGRPQRARDVLKLLEGCGMQLTRSLFVPLVSALGEARKYDEAAEIVAEMERRGLAVENWMTRFGGKHKSTEASTPAAGEDEASSRGWSVQERTMHLKNLLGASRTQEAERVLAVMEEHGPAPNVRTYTLMIGHYGAKGDFEKLEQLLARMRQRGVRPDFQTHSKLLRAYAHHKRPEEAIRYYEQLRSGMNMLGIPLDAQHYHDAISSYALTKNVDKATALAEEMLAAKLKPLGATFVKLVVLMVQLGRSDAALLWATRMVEAGYTLMEPLASKVRLAKIVDKAA